MRGPGDLAKHDSAKLADVNVALEPTENIKELPATLINIVDGNLDTGRAGKTLLNCSTCLHH